MTNTKTSKYQKRTRVPFYRRPIIMIPLGIVGILVVILIVWLCNRPQPSQAYEEDPVVPSDSTGQTVEPSPEEVPTSQPEDDQPAPKVIQYEGADPNDAEELSGSVSNTSVENGSLFVAVTIAQFLEHPGTCTLSLINTSGETVATVNGPARADVTTSVCQLPEMSVSGLPSGEYQIIIKVDADGKTGSIKDGVTL